MKVSVVLLIFCFWVSPLSAQVSTHESDVVNEDPEWVYPNANIYDGIFIGAAITTAITSRVIGPAEGRWRGGILADNSVRDALKLRTRAQQRSIEGFSDLSLALVTAMPAIDATVLAFGVYRDPELARELGILNVEVTFFLAAIQTLATSISGRERPYGQRCGKDINPEHDDCTSRDRHYSFFSGHSTQAFGSAALTCSTHARFKLLGGGFADFAPCLAGFSLAIFTASARVMADKHYFSDVITGSILGTATGFLLPYLLRYRHGASERSWRLMPTGNGIGVGGSF